MLGKAGLSPHDVQLDYLQPAQGLAAFSSGAVDAWDAQAQGPAAIAALIVTDDVVYVGGDYTAIGGGTGNGEFQAVDAVSGATVPTWTNPMVGGPVLSMVRLGSRIDSTM